MLGEDLDGAPVTVDVPTLIDSRGVITASSGGGKSYLLRKMIETILQGGLAQVIVIDPEGDFRTLREKFDLVIVGAGGDIPADQATARRLAGRLAELRVSAVVDLLDLDDWASRRAWLAEFLTGLMAIPKALYHPIFLPIDEAHKFAPEAEGGRPDSPLAACRAAVNSLMSAGRKRAICGVLATQRISKLAKDAIGDARNVWVGGITLDIDQQRAGDMLGLSKAGRLGLRDLQPGEFHAYGPAFDSRAVYRFTTGPVITTHPRPGQRHLVEAPPASGAITEILSDLADLPAQVQADAETAEAGLQAAIESAQMIDTLRGENNRLRAELTQAIEYTPPAPEPARVYVFRDGEVDRLSQTLAAVTEQAETAEAAANGLRAASDNALETAAGLLKTAEALHLTAAGLSDELTAALAKLAAAPAARPAQAERRPAAQPAGPVTIDVAAFRALSSGPSPHAAQQAAGRGGAVSKAAAARPAQQAAAESEDVTAALQQIMGALAAGPLTKGEVAVRAGYSVKGGHLGRLITKARGAGLITAAGESKWELTPAGRAAWDGNRAPRGRALVAFWVSRLPEAAGRVLDYLYQQSRGGPAITMNARAIAEACGYSGGGGHFNRGLTRLRGLGLITGGSARLRLSDEIANA